MRRREVIASLGAALCCSPKALAQATARVYRVGLLSTLAPISNESEQGAAFISAMARAGYVLGQNLILERRGAMGQVERLPALVQELIEAKVDVLVVNGYRTAVAAKASGHPTVAAAGTGDAVLTGLVESFARPGGNITGISEASAELSTKRLGLLKELVPDLRRVAMLWNQDDLGMTLRYRASSEAAEKLGVKVQALGVRAPDEFEAAFSAMDAERPDAILMVADSLTNSQSEARDRLRATAASAGDIRTCIYRQGWRVDVLRRQPGRTLRSRRSTDRSHSQRRQACRSAVRAADTICLCLQHENRKGHRT